MRNVVVRLFLKSNFNRVYSGSRDMASKREKSAATVEPSAAGVISASDRWESAYLRFETPEQEVNKFLKRLRRLGAAQWPRDARIVELFCGRGNGLHALERMGFTHIEGIDASSRLVAQYRGNAVCCVSDCRMLPFADGSKDVLIVQGGFHHLPDFPDDLTQILLQMHRVLRKDGVLLVVEPWRTPFLTFAHLVCENSLTRRLSNKIDSLSTMIQYEREAYEQWLAHPDLILTLVRKYFEPQQESFAWGKWNFSGRRRSTVLP